MSHSAEKIKRGDPLASDGFVDYVKKVQNERGTLWRQKNFSKKVAQCRKKNRKNRKGGLCRNPSGFVGYLEKVLH